MIERPGGFPEVRYRHRADRPDPPAYPPPRLNAGHIERLNYLNLKLCSRRELCRPEVPDLGPEWLESLEPPTAPIDRADPNQPHIPDSDQEIEAPLVDSNVEDKPPESQPAPVSYQTLKQP